MKHPIFFRTVLLACLLLFFLLPVHAQMALRPRLDTLAAASQTEALESTAFVEKYVTYFTQPLDHAHPEEGTFRQRVVVAHVGFDRPTVLVTEGYGAAYALRPAYREELSRLLNANLVFVEHRYFLASTPSPKDWRYLTAANSAADLHAVTAAFKTLYPGKWIATGISKGGQTALLYRAFFPDDVDITVPYVAPLCYRAEDGRHEPFLRQVSTPADRKAVEDFQLEVLKRKATILPRFERYCQEKHYAFTAPLAEIYDFCVLEYSFSLWQWGTPVSTIPAVTASDDVLFAHLLAVSEPSYFALDGPNASFFVQAARELGYYGYDTAPFKPYLTIKTARNYLSRLMLPAELQGMKFDKTLARKVTLFLKKNDPRIIFIYGQNDPWTAAGVTWLKGKQQIHVFVQPGGSHLARIGTLPEDMKKEVIALITSWIEETD
ncbi:MAG: S28 family serine protease [Bacteroides sp.]